MVEKQENSMLDGIEEFKKILELDEMIREEILEEGLRSFPQKIRDIHKAILNGDAKKVSQYAHAVKGSVGYFSNGSLYKLAYELEMLGKKNDLEAALPVYEKLKFELERLCMFFSVPGWQKYLQPDI